MSLDNLLGIFLEKPNRMRSQVGVCFRLLSVTLLMRM